MIGTIIDVLAITGVIAIFVPFACMCAMCIKDTIDYITDKDIEENEEE